MGDYRGESGGSPSDGGGWRETPRNEGRAIARFLRWWWLFTAPDDPGCGASFAEREHARVGRLTSVVLLGVITLSAMSLPTSLSKPILSLSGVFSIAMSCFALVVNRKGLVTTAAILLVASTNIALMVGVWSLPDQKLSLIWLFVAIVVMAASLLPPLAMFPLVLAQCLFVLLDFMLQPNTDEYTKIRASGNYIVLLAPILGQLFIALVAYLWVSSTSHALQRADRAEELVELRERDVRRTLEEAERRRELEQGLAQMQSVLSQLANGNFHARVRPLRDPQLWQLGNTLNHFIGRLARLGQSEFTLKRTDEESQRLADAIYVMRSGRQPIWPVVSGTPLDRVIEALTVEMARNVSEVMSARPKLALDTGGRESGAAQTPTVHSTASIIVTGTLLPVTGALIVGAGTPHRHTGSLVSGASGPSTAQREAESASATDVKAPATGAAHPRLDTAAEPAPRRSSGNGQLALPSPEPSFALPPWLKRQQPLAQNGVERKRTDARSERATQTALPDWPATGSLPSLRTPDMFTTPGSDTPSRPSQPPRRPVNTLPRVRLESGSLPERPDGMPSPPQPASPTRH